MLACRKSPCCRDTGGLYCSIQDIIQTLRVAGIWFEEKTVRTLSCEIAADRPVGPARDRFTYEDFVAIVCAAKVPIEDLAAVTMPELVGGHRSSILREDDMVWLRSELPPSKQACAWELVYSLDRDGASLTSLYHRCSGGSSGKRYRSPGDSSSSRRATGQFLIVLRDSAGVAFGGYAAGTAFCPPPAVRGQGAAGARAFTQDAMQSAALVAAAAGKGVYDGLSESFVFSLARGPHQSAAESVKYGSTGANDFFLLCTDDMLAMGGGGGGFAFAVGEDLGKGASSAPSSTFANRRPLCALEFTVRGVEKDNL